MAGEPGSEERTFERAEVNLCIFPHLREFLVIDLRRGLPQRPSARLLKAGEVFAETFYREVEGAFSAMLRDQDHPFATLMALPPRVEALVRERALAAILRKVNEGVSEEQMPRVAILLCSGPILTADSPRLTRTIQYIFGSGVDPWLVMDTVEMMEKLLAQERAVLQELERMQLRQALLGKGDDFLTLWENQG
ncbi:MAG: hypothetical protein HY686_01915 [Chloroflexi bacterium]|nr:hypothetical protein [Chloroflexota bacterium]